MKGTKTLYLKSAHEGSMGDEGPKLFSSRPRKSKLKVSTMASSSPGGTAPHPKAPSRSHYRVIVPLILGLNFTIGAYVLVKTALRNQRLSEEQSPPTSTSNPTT